MRCSGRESNILDCPHDPNTRDCSHSEDAGVRCIAGGEETTFTITSLHVQCICDISVLYCAAGENFNSVHVHVYREHLFKRKVHPKKS